MKKIYTKIFVLLSLIFFLGTTQNKYWAQYCIPTYTSGCITDYISGVSTTGAITNFTNPSGCSGAGYIDYTATHSASQVQGSTFDFNVNIGGGWSQGVKIWVDWDQDGEFSDATEMAYSSPTTSAVGFSGTITVPVDAVPGNTRMRVKCVFASTIFGACGSTTFGETEDYEFIVVSLVDCEEVALAAGTLGDVEICPSTSFTVNNTGTTLASGILREWQTRPVGDPTWTTIPGATGINYTNPTGITVPTEYRCIVTCLSTGETLITNTATVNLSSFLDCYCVPTYTSSCTGGGRIDDVITTGAVVNINNVGTNCTGAVGSISDFTATHNMTQIQGVGVNIDVKILGWACGVKVWIDYDQNGVYDADELVTASAGVVAAGSVHSGSFVIPLTAVPGETRMRVRAVEGSTSFTPCSTHSWGEVEDYTVNIVPATPCSDPSIVFPTSADVTSTPTMVCGTGNVYLSLLTSMPISLGITYQWESAPTAAGPWTVYSPDITTPGYLAMGISTDTYFRCIIKCEGTQVLASNSTFVESVTPESPVLSSGQHCGPGSVILTGTVGSGTIFWYESPSGGSPIGVGTTFETPEIDVTTTYYASAGASPSIDTFVGTGAGITGSSVASPFYYVWGGYKHQYMITAAELSAIGLEPGSSINSIGVDVTSMSGFPTFNDFTVQVGFSPTGFMGAYVGGLTTAFGPIDYTPTAGINTFGFAAPIIWDGASNLVIQTCFSNEDWGGTSINVRYENTASTNHLYYYMDLTPYATICSTESYNSTTARPFFYFNIPGCETPRIPVEAFIRDTPVINITEADGTYCLFNDEFTINTNPEVPTGSSLLWSTGATTPSITVGPSDPDTKFWVEITNEWGCKNSDSIILTLNPSPVVELGPDQLICEGGSLELDAGPDGVSYFWNTGESTRTITVDEDGQYTVLVTNSFGCMATDTVNLTVDGYAPEIAGIIVNHLGGNTFQFTAHLPAYIESYEWDFGDSSPVSHAHSPIKTYTTPGTYLVTCRVTSTCATREYTTYTNIFTGVGNQDLQNMFNVYPNPTNDYIHIETDMVNMESIRVTNILGQNVLEATELTNKKSVKLDVTRLPSGTYHINITTEKGNVIKSFQVVK